MENGSTFEKFDELQISSQTKNVLAEAAKWANFIAIMGFVGIGFIFIGAIMVLVFGASGSFALNSVFPLGGTFFIAIVYLLMGAMYFFPLYYLYMFANNIKKAVAADDNGALSKGILFLKSHYKFIGIMIIVMLAFYALFFVVALVGGLSRWF